MKGVRMSPALKRLMMLIVALSVTWGMIGLASPSALAAHCEAQNVGTPGGSGGMKYASWGCGSLGWDGSYIRWSLDDRLTDGYCVSIRIKTVAKNYWHAPVGHSTTSCGSPVTSSYEYQGSTVTQARLIRGSNYLTLK